jgi:hypothetical protein
VGKTGLSRLYPLAINSVTVTYQNPRPVPNQFLKCLFGPARLDAVKSHGGVNHHPQPGKKSMLVPGSLVYIIDLSAARLGRDGFIIRQDRPGNPIHATLNSSTAYADPEHRLAKLLHGASTASLASTQFTHKGSEPLPVSNPETIGNHTLADFSASRALSLHNREMGDLHLDFGKLDVLMNVELFEVPKFLTSEIARLGRHLHHFGGFQERLPMPFVAMFGSGLAFSFRFSLLSLVRRVRGRRAVRIVRILSKLGFQFFHAFHKLCDYLLLPQYERLDAGRRLVLLKNGGFICLLLCKAFMDTIEGRTYKNTDLVKRSLNYDSFYREDLNHSSTYIRAVRNEFDRFFGLYGMAHTHFSNHNADIPWFVLATVKRVIVGFIFDTQEIFVPTLIPEQHQISEYFEILSEALVSTINKLLYEIPEWVMAFKFSEEDSIEDRKVSLIAEIRQIEQRSEILSNFKRVLLCDGDLLVDSVTDIFNIGFGLRVDNFDEYREDLKLLDTNASPMALCEVKGTNAGVKREHVNQADSHRERAGLPHDFPTLLTINTHIKNSRNLTEKHNAVPAEQIQHAALNNVLINHG